MSLKFLMPCYGKTQIAYLGHQRQFDACENACSLSFLCPVLEKRKLNIQDMCQGLSAHTSTHVLGGVQV